MATRGKGDDVASLRVWQDVLHKEMRFLSTSRAGTFTLNPKTLRPVTHKIGHEPVTSAIGRATSAGGSATSGASGMVGHGVAAAEAARRREADVAALRATIASATAVPKAKFKRPATVSQEVGWFAEAAREMEDPDAEPRATHAQSDEVAYAEQYYNTFRCGPYSRTQTVAR